MATKKTTDKLKLPKHIPRQDDSSLGDEWPRSPKRAGPDAREDSTDARLLKRRRSGGAKSDEGKSIVKHNSRTHGAYAQVPSETEEYFSLSRQVASDLKPNGVIQMTMADSVASDLYRVRSIESYERRLVNAALNGPVNVYELAKRVGFPWGEDFYEVLAEPIPAPRLQRELFEGWQRLAAPPSSSSSRDLECMPDSRVAKNYDLVCEKFSKAGLLLPHMEEGFFEMLDGLMLEAKQLKSYLGRRIHEKGEELFLVKYWIFRNQQSISLHTHELRDEKALQIMTSEQLTRAHTNAANIMAKRIDAFAAMRKLAK